MPVEFTGGAWWPERRTWALGHPVVNTLNPYNLGIPTKRLGIVCRAPHTGTLTGFAVTLGSAGDVSGGSSTYQFALQGVDATTGLPDGTNLVGVGLTQPLWPVQTLFRAEPMSGTYAVTRGDLVACTMAFIVQGTSGSAFWTAVQQPQNLQVPPWRVAWDETNEWVASGSPQYMPAGLVLFYTDSALDGPPDGLMPLAVFARCAGALVTAGPVGMAFTVPRSLRCVGFSFHHAPTGGTALSLYENDVLVGAGEIAAHAGFSDWAITFIEVTLRPGRAYRAEVTATSGTFQIKGYRSVLGPAGASPPTAPANIPADWPALSGHADDFEGGPTWLAYGDDAAHYDPLAWGDAPPLPDRWFLSLHLLGDAEELVVETTPGARPRCVVIPVCPEAEEPGPSGVTPSVFAAWSPGRGPLHLRARRRGRR